MQHDLLCDTQISPTLDMQGTICWTDHKLVRAKLRSCSHHECDREAPSIAVWKFADALIHEDYCRELSNQLESMDSNDACGMEER